MKRMELIKPTHVKKQKQKKKTKPKSKKSDFKKDLEWYVNKGSFKKIDRNKLVVYQDGDKPKEQYKSTRKFPLTGWWVFLEKHHNNKWKACLRKMKEQYWEDFVCSGYCKAGQPALDALYNKLNKL